MSVAERRQDRRTRLGFAHARVAELGEELVHLARCDQRRRKFDRHHIARMAQLERTLQLLDSTRHIALAQIDPAEQEARLGEVAVLLQGVLELDAGGVQILLLDEGLRRDHHLFGRLAAAGEQHDRKGCSGDTGCGTA